MAILETTEHFRKAIAYLQSINHFGGAILQMNIGDTVAECEVLDDETLTDLTPDTPTLETALDGALAELTQAGNIAAAKTGLLDKVDLAETHAVTIRILFNAVLDQTQQQTAQPARFDTLKTVIQNAPLAFRERLITDCVQELGFDVTGTLTAAQIRQATLYVRMWVTGLALLLSVA